MITHVRNLVQDLIERRLWPVALLLAVALAAVPVVLGRGGDDAASTAALPTTPATGDASTGQKAEVTLDTSAPAEHAGGNVRNPFKAPATPKATKRTRTAASTEAASAAPSPTPSVASPTPAASSSASTGSSTTTATPSTGSSSGNATTTTNPKTTTSKPKPKTTTAPKADDAADTYHVSLRFGVNGGERKTQRDVARLSALPSVTDPFFVYLGVIETTTTHEKRAVFLVSSDATPTGEGACHPTKEDCQSVELAVGQTMFFDLAAPNGGPGTQYELELAGIHKTEVSTEAKASAAFARHSAAGAELLSDAAKRNVRAAAGARAYRYIPATGLLQRAKRKHVTARAAAAGTMIPGLALVSRKDQPGIPVWHSPQR